MLPIIESFAIYRVNRKHYDRGVNPGYDRMASFN